jgi:hypothetical protein
MVHMGMAVTAVVGLLMLLLLLMWILTWDGACVACAGFDLKSGYVNEFDPISHSCVRPASCYGRHWATFCPRSTTSGSILSSAWSARCVRVRRHVIGLACTSSIIYLLIVLFSRLPFLLSNLPAPNALMR